MNSVTLFDMDEIITAEIDGIIAEAAQVLKPPPDLKVSGWADERRWVSREVSSYPGRWQTSKVPYMREIMDCVNDKRVEEIVVQKGSRMALTEGLVNNTIGYHIDLDPCPILYAQQTLGEGQKYSNKILKYLLRDTPVLAGKVAEAKSRDSANTKLHKTFPGGDLTIIGANTPTGFRMIEVRIAIGDDIDGWEYEAGHEGDQVDLLRGRTDNAPDRKIILISSPSIKHFSRIEAEFNGSDKRFYHVPCPHCDHGQILRFGGKQFDYGFKWKNNDPETTYYLCEDCHKPIQEWHKTEMMNLGIWKATAPFTKRAGFHISRFYSLMYPWKGCVDKWLKAQKQPKKLQVVVNTIFGETYEDKSDSIKDTGLYARRENYGSEVPIEALVLTAGVDIQDDRIEIEVPGWGADEESWNMDYKIFVGDTAQQHEGSVWDDLDKFLLTPLKNKKGEDVWIRCVAIDHGHRSKQVEAFVRARQARRVAPGIIQRIIAVKGSSHSGKPIIAARPAKKNKGKIHIYEVGTDTAKDTIFSYARLKEFGPGYMHYPIGDEDKNYLGRDMEYFKQLTAEKVFKVLNKSGVWVRVWRKKEGARNEALDCRVYALAGLMHLVNNYGLNLNRMVEQLLIVSSEEKPAVPVPGKGQRRIISRGVRREDL